MTGISGIGSSSLTAIGNYLNHKDNIQPTSTSRPAGQTDQVSISPAGQALADAAQAAGSADSSGQTGNNLLSAQSLADRFIYTFNHLDEITEQFQQDLKQDLRELGVDVDTAFELRAGYDGQVGVAGDHPDRAQIEQYFKDNPEMRDRFAEISATTSAKRAFELHLQFAEEYEKDPEAAVAKYMPLFEALKREGYSMTVGGAAQGTA